MPKPWNKNVRGTQVLPLINLDADTIRAEAGPGTGKTFGLVRRVQRILHPEGLAVPGGEVLIVAFNRVIAKQLKAEIGARLEESPHDGEPVIRTVHALCRRDRHPTAPLTRS
jgi:superfamily I DNA/RNA helicase